MNLPPGLPSPPQATNQPQAASPPLAQPGAGTGMNLLGLSHTALGEYCAGLGEKPFRATQLFRWIHRKGAGEFAEMSDLAKSFRERLVGQACVAAPQHLSEQVAADGTTKWLFDMGAGDAVETVFIPEEDRATLCVSSQAGCAVGCRFCATGHQGFSRNLSTAEIIGQLWFAEHRLRGRNRSGAGQSVGADTSERVIGNVVMMGMGEPLQNYGALLPALRIMLDEHGYGISRRRLTVSTSGVVPMIERLRDDCPVALAVSLHAPDDALRSELVPLNRKYGIAELLAACRRYLERSPRDFITVEYCLLDGVNDSVEHAERLVALLGTPGSGVQAERGLAAKVNLIPFNPFEQSGLKRSPRERVMAFAEVLRDAGLIATVRKTRGDDIAAACGQLAGEVQDRTRVTERMRSAPVRWHAKATATVGAMHPPGPAGGAS